MPRNVSQEHWIAINQVYHEYQGADVQLACTVLAVRQLYSTILKIEIFSVNTINEIIFEQSFN